jgi:hypothetical protein
MLGLLTVGCGSGGAAAAPDETGTEQPPANPEQPPNDSVHTSNSDQAPVNPDQPPANSDGLAGGGGQAEGLCRAFCDTFEDQDCKGPSGTIVRFVCDSGCVLGAAQACASEFAAALSCLSGLSGLCTDGFTQEQARACEPAFDAADACDEANQPGNGNGNGNGNACTTEGGCECTDPCLACYCDATGDAAATLACLTGACAQQ